MSLLVSRIGGCQSFGGFTTCFPSVTNHSNRGQPEETEAWSQFKPNAAKQRESENESPPLNVATSPVCALGKPF